MKYPLLLLCATAFAVDPTAIAIYPIWNVPNAVAIADFDGDGNPDRAETSVANTVTIQLGSAPISEVPATGLKEQSFRFKASYQTGMNPRSIRAADLNGDGKFDLVIANRGSNDVSVLLGKGDGTFKSAVSYAAGTAPVCVALADLNADGKLDLAVSNDFSADVSVLLGKGDGTFQPAVSYKTRSNADSIALVDFNGDGKLDLAVATASVQPNDIIAILPGRGDGTFGSAVNFFGVSGPRGIVIGQPLPGSLPTQ